MGFGERGWEIGGGGGGSVGDERENAEGIGRGKGTDVEDGFGFDCGWEVESDDLGDEGVVR